MSGKKRIAKSKEKFDMSTNSNNELFSLVVDAALASGFPQTKSLFLWHMTSAEWKLYVEAAVRPRIIALNKQYETWRHHVCKVQCGKRRRRALPTLTAQDHDARVAEQKDLDDAKQELLTGYAVFIGGMAACNLMTWLMDQHKDQYDGRQAHFTFRLTWTLLASMSLERCMACAGMGMKCVVPIRTKQMIQWPCGQARIHMCARQKCIESQTLELHNFAPLAWVERDMAQVKTDEEKLKWYNGVMARSMLAQKHLFAESKGTGACAESMDAFYGKSKSASSPRPFAGTGLQFSRLFLLYNNYVPKDRTLQGRLQLTHRAVERAKIDTDRVVRMQRDEDKTRFETRLQKWTGDFDVFIQRISKGRLTVETLAKTYPNLLRTVRRIAHLHDPLYAMKLVHRKQEFEPCRGYLYTNGMSIVHFRNLVFQVLYAAMYLAPFDAHNVGHLHAASTEAQEWACWLYGGGAIGPTGSHRSELDKVKLPRIFPKKDQVFGFSASKGCPIPLEEMAALHVFDAVGTGGVSFELSADRTLDRTYWRWWITCDNGKFSIGGDIPRRTRDELVLWHAMLVDAFEKLESKPDIELPANVPCQRVFDGVRKRKDCEKELASYYEDVSALVLFSGTRALFFHFLGMTVGTVGRELRRHFEDRQKRQRCPEGQGSGGAQPFDFLEYYRMISGAPYNSAPSPSPDPADPADPADPTDPTEVSAASDGEESQFVPYFPTSPAYSPTSPTYKPAHAQDSSSPVYSPTSPPKDKVVWSRGICACLRARPKAAVCTRHGTRAQQVAMYRAAVNASTEDNSIDDDDMPRDEGVDDDDVYSESGSWVSVSDSDE